MESLTAPWRHSKHEVIHCECCNKPFECKSNSSIYCQCSQVVLSLEEAEFISEQYDTCLCVNCLEKLKLEYQSDFI